MLYARTIKLEYLDHHKYILFTEDLKSSCQISIYNKIQDFGGNVCIHSLFVDKQFHKQGIATLLLKEAENLAKQEGYSEVFTNFDSNESEDFVPEMYIKLGYKPIFISYKKTLE